MCSLLRAKGFTWISLVGHILVFVPRFDSEFVMTRMTPDLKSTLFSTKVCVSIWNFSENELFRKDRTSYFLAYGEAGKRVVEFQANLREFF